jgi:transposase-like protein
MAVRIERIVELIKETGGNIAAVARACNRDWSTIAERIQKSPVATKALRDAREATGDAVENALIQSAIEGNTTAQIFYLKCRRNWREHHHVHIEDVNVQALTDEELESLAAVESTS